MIDFTVDAEELRKKIEKDILVIIEEKLTNGQMDVERAQSIARMVLDLLHPPLTLEEIYQVAPSLDDEFTELTSAVLPVLEEHEDRLRQVVAEHAERLIRSGKFKEAGDLLKKANQEDSL